MPKELKDFKVGDEITLAEATQLKTALFKKAYENAGYTEGNYDGEYPLKVQFIRQYKKATILKILELPEVK